MISGQNFSNFGLNEDSVGEELSTSKLKDVVNIYLVMQSEFLRRLALCLSCDLRSASVALDIGQDLKLMSNICDDVMQILNGNCQQLRLCLRYNQALGCGDSQNGENLSTVKILPGEGSAIRPSVTSGCLHLQNCLLKMREIENSDLHNGNTSGLSVTKENLQEIMNELSVCQEAVQESIEIVSNILNPEDKILKMQSDEEDTTKVDKEGNITLIPENKEIKHYDEVFEAFIKDSDHKLLNKDDQEDMQEAKEKLKDSKQTKKVLRELKSVLVGKQREWKVREEKALARQNGENLSIETNTDVELKQCLDVQQEKQGDRYSLGSSSDCDIDQDDSDDDSTEDKTSIVGHTLLNNHSMFRRPKHPKKSTKSKGNFSSLESTETQLPSVIDNVITDKEGRLRTLNTQPIGFDNRLVVILRTVLQYYFQTRD